MEKIVIFGATGMTGLCAVEAAIKKGLNVRTFVRDPAKLPENLKEKVEIAKGDVLNYEDVLNAVKDVNGVVIILGTRNDLNPTTALSEGTANILKAMKEAKVEIVSACLSAFLFYEPDKVPERFRPLNSEHQRMFELIKESNLKYIAVFPPHIADQPGSEYEVKHGEIPGRRVISKYGLGRFLVDSLLQPEHYGQSCGISATD